MKLKPNDRVNVRDPRTGLWSYGTVEGEGPNPDGAWPVRLDSGERTAAFPEECYVVRQAGFLAEGERRAAR